MTLRLSSTVTVPPAESIVKFPESVSISLASILTLSISALVLTSRTPDTVKLSSTVTAVSYTHLTLPTNREV